MYGSAERLVVGRSNIAKCLSSALKKKSDKKSFSVPHTPNHALRPLCTRPQKRPAPKHSIIQRILDVPHPTPPGPAPSPDLLPSSSSSSKVEEWAWERGMLGLPPGLSFEDVRYSAVHRYACFAETTNDAKHDQTLTAGSNAPDATTAITVQSDWVKR